MLHARLTKSSAFMVFFVGLSACWIEGDSEAEIDSKLGPTVMSRCAIMSGQNVSFDDLAAELSIFADANGLKFLNDRPSGAFGTYLQVDDPYVVIDHLYFPRRKPPEHMLITFRPPSGHEGKPIEDSFYEFLAGIAPLSSCGGYRATITSGWRLKE